MEEIKQYKKTFSVLGCCYLVGTIAVYGLQLLISFIVGVLRLDWLANININMLLSCLIVYGVGMPLIVLLARKLPVRKPERHAMKWWQFVLAFIMSYALVFISNLIGLLTTGVIGFLKGNPVQNKLLDVVTQGNMFLNFIYMVVIAPIVEELVFRKVLVDRTLRYGQGVAILVSGLMFGLFHGNLNQFVYAVVLGMFFAFLYVKTGNIKITMGLHAMINFLGSVVATKVMDLIDLDSVIELENSLGNASGAMGASSSVMNMVMANPVGWAIYVLYAFLILAVVLTGFILFIVFLCCGRFKLEPGEVRLPKGKRFSTVILNPGMLVFCGFWIVLIVLQLLA